MAQTKEKAINETKQNMIQVISLFVRKVLIQYLLMARFSSGFEGQKLSGYLPERGL